MQVVEYAAELAAHPATWMAFPLTPRGASGQYQLTAPQQVSLCHTTCVDRPCSGGMPSRVHGEWSHLTNSTPTALALLGVWPGTAWLSTGSCSAAVPLTYYHLAAARLIRETCEWCPCSSAAALSISFFCHRWSCAAVADRTLQHPKHVSCRMGVGSAVYFHMGRTDCTTRQTSPRHTTLSHVTRQTP